jgi:hypothetical protein
MIDTVLNLLFRCAHRRLTRPVSALTKAGQPRGAAYVVCLDCGKQFAYDVERMHIGKPIEKSPTEGVLPPEPPRAQTNKKLKLALLASVPVALVIGSALKPKKRLPEKPPEKPRETE